MRYAVSIVRTFSAAHALRGYRGRCERLHGHNWKVRVSLSGKRLNDIGMVMDFGEIKALLDRVVSALDHRYINEVPPFDTVNPTAENIAGYICRMMSKELKSARRRPPVAVAAVEVWESETSSATVGKDNLP